MQKFTPRDYLKIDIANNFGLDKEDWDTRINWFNSNEHRILDLLSEAEEPALYYAGVQALDAVNKGQPIGYPVSLDATSSGLQILAVLTGDREAAEICNVVDTGHRRDAYTIVYQRMVNKIGENSRIKRKDTKQAIMTSLYGSKAVPKEVFGEGVLLKVFFDIMQQSAPAAWELNMAFLDIWNPEAYSNDWVLPDNFHVHVKVMSQVRERIHFLNQPVDVYYKVNAPMEEGRSLGANTIHSLDGMMVREITRRCDYQPSVIKEVQRIVFTCFDCPLYIEDNKDNRMVMTLWDHYTKSGYLSARILDHINEENIHLVDRGVIQELLDSLPVKPFKVISVHDCFRCLPNYANDLREQYNRQLMLIGKSNLLSYLLSQIMGKSVSIGKLDPNLWKDVMTSNYALS